MDLDEWEFLSDDGFLDFGEDGDEKQIFLGKRNSESKTVFDMDYFCPSSPNPMKRTEASRNPRVHNQLVPVPIRLEPRIGKAPDDGLVKEIAKDPDEVTVVVPSATTEKIKGSHIGGDAVEADQDTVSHVFFKIKENEFVDMKMDSPKSGSRGFNPPIDTGTLKFEDKGEAKEIMTSPRMKVEKEMLSMDLDKGEDSTWDDNNNGGFNLWKWSLTGIGAICSFGVAAATICVLFFGSQQRNKLQLQQDQKIRFQIYTDDKRIKQVVQHATKLNEAISAVRGVPLSRAHITYGGYYDGL